MLLGACQVSTGGGGPDKGGEEGEEKEETPDRRVLVEAAPVARGEVADHLVTTGSLESEGQADIVPEATGVVTQLLVEEGDSVRKGQLLAVLSNPTLEAGAQRAQLEIERARREVETARALHGRGAISDQELRTAEEAFRTAETSFTEATRTQGFTRIQSPIDGTVSARDLRLGEVAGGQRAFQVVDLSRLRVVVQLPEKDLARVRQGQVVVLQGAYDEAAQGQGVVSRVSPVVDTRTGTVRVTIDVDANSTTLRPGQFVKVRVEVDRHADVLTIPRRALVWIDGVPVAWKVVEGKAEEEKAAGDEPGEGDAKGDGKDQAAAEEPGFFAKLFQKEDAGEDEAAEDEPPPWPLRMAERADLEIGYQDPERVEILAGLAEGEQVVTLGNQNLRGGTPLRLPEDPGPEAARKKDADEDADKASDADKAADGVEG
ncbi:efflux RND transporter periplasmic adaptor subunit [Myxococcota bacterium]|nr:efflux RND transporter periplasmic adaptor subunit [Myxococcota bacterium]